MDLNDLSALMKMERLQLSWLMQSVPTWFHPKGRFETEWAACVSSLEKRKGNPNPEIAHGYGTTPEEAILSAIDTYRNPPLMNWQKPKPKPIQLELDDLEIEL